MIRILGVAFLGAAMASGAQPDPRVSNASLELTVSAAAGEFQATDKRIRRTWRQEKWRDAQAPAAVKASGRRVEMTFPGFAAVAELDAGSPEFVVTVSGQGPLKQPLGFPAPFAASPGTSLIVPLNEGIHYPVGDESIKPRQLITYGGHGISMPWFGVMDAANGAGYMAIIETPDDARIDITRGGAGLLIRPLWEASRQEFRYPRRIRYVFLDKGGYVAMAKRYRSYAQQKGLFKTLAEKRRENPNVDLLIGAANVWNWDMDKVALCQEMKAAGMDHVLWSSGGKPEQIEAINKLGYLTSRYDIYQDVWPPDAPANLRKEGWPEDLVLLPNGDWMKGWAAHRKNPDGTVTVYQGGVISSPRQVARARQRIPEELRTHPYKCRFIDTTTASPFREDYHPDHPLTRSEDKQYKMSLLEFCSREMKLVTGTETGIDPAVPYVHYFEGMLSLGPYRLPDAGRDMLLYKPPTPDFLKFQVGHFYRLPLWELVYHDCVVSQWYWGDYNNKAPEVWDRRDLFNILYGTPPMYMFNRATWEKEKARFVASYKNICPLVRGIGYDEMLAHEWLTPDHAVQRTRWRSGKEIVANFGEKPHKLADGRTVEPMGWLAR